MSLHFPSPVLTIFRVIFIHPPFSKGGGGGGLQSLLYTKYCFLVAHKARKWEIQESGGDVEIIILVLFWCANFALPTLPFPFQKAQFYSDALSSNLNLDLCGVSGLNFDFDFASGTSVVLIA